MIRVRIWVPFLIGLFGAWLWLPLERPIREFLGDNPILGSAGLTLYAGALIAAVAAVASGTYRGVLTLVLGFATAGAPFGLFATGALGVILSFLGVPTYVAVVTVVKVVRAPRTPPGPVAGWPPVSSGSIPPEPPEDGPPPS